jgi:hypothetical protein
MLGLYRMVIPSSRTTSDFSLAVLLIVNTRVGPRISAIIDLDFTF